MKKKQYNEPLVEVMRVCTQEMMIIEGGTTGAVPLDQDCLAELRVVSGLKCSNS